MNYKGDEEYFLDDLEECIDNNDIDAFEDILYSEIDYYYDMLIDSMSRCRLYTFEEGLRRLLVKYHTLCGCKYY